MFETKHVAYRSSRSAYLDDKGLIIYLMDKKKPHIYMRLFYMLLKGKTIP